MKKSFIISIAALMLCACGGTNQNSGNNSTAPNENDTLSEYVAYQVYKLINPDSAAALPRYERGKLYYESYSSPDPETDRSESVWCFPKKGDGYVVVYELEDCMSVGDCFGCEILAFKIYDFSNGQFKEDKSLLPKPSFDDFYKNEALWFYNPKDKNLDSTKASFVENGFKYMCYGPDTIAAFVTGYGDESLKIFYRFDGEKFVATTKNNENPLYPLITEYGLGCIHIGEIPPQKLPGFDVNTMGRTIYYNRNAKKEFKISLAADGTTDTITIYSPKYSYRFWGGGYGYLNVGSDAVSDEFTNCFKDNDMYNASADDDDYYLNPDGGVINFHAPEHKKIEYIKIYKKGNTESTVTAEENGSWEPTPTATGDLNGDGIKDSAAFNNGFSVYFGTGDGKYNLFKKYKVYPHETNDYVSFTTSVKINNGKLIISTRREGDGWENYDYTAKFQDGDFVIVNILCDEGLDGSTTEVLNFEEKTYKGDFDGYEEDSYSVTAKLKNLPLPKLSAIQIGGNSYEFFHKYIDDSTSKTK